MTTPSEGSPPEAAPESELPAWSPPGGGPAPSRGEPEPPPTRPTAPPSPPFTPPPAALPIAGSSAGGAPQRLHPLTPLFSAVLLARQFLAPGIIFAGLGQFGILATLVVAQLGFATLSWLRRSYAFDGEVLRVESGVLSRNQELIPARRIQQVNVVQKLRHRAFGVAELRVETAGGAGGSGTALEVVATEEAHRLRDALLAAKARARQAPTPTGVDEGRSPDDGAEPAPVWVPTPWPVVSLTYGQLVVAGLTGAELLVFFAVLASLLPIIGEVPGPVLEQLGAVDDGIGPLAVAALVVLFVVAWLGSAVASSILRDGGYVLSLVGDELHGQRGLLDRKEGALPLRRIQAVRITASPLRRALRLVSVRFQSAGRGTGGADSRIDVPILPAGDVDRVLDLALPGAAPVPPLLRPPRVALRRAVLRRVVPVAVIALPVGLWQRPVGLIGAAVVVGLCVPWGVAAYRGLGHAVNDRFLYARTGAFVRKTAVVPTARAQSARVARSPFQRRLDLGTLAVHLAGPGEDPRVVDESAAVAEELLRRLMADVAATPGSGDRDHGPAPSSR